MGDDGIEWELEDLDGGVLYDVFYESWIGYNVLDSPMRDE